ncbi:hypothetical protein KC573_01280 [candidate division WWE3 bacterium]|uniref:Uncharacterized protein n=1 Tax=candidate division WWE3 bacterium TaxID=2053526 RepID=A0A955RW35_UNCKA|nr:hypothetical protein [candidate division WWE3 bacterium]
MIDSLIKKYFPDGLTRDVKPLSTSSWHYRLYNVWLGQTDPEAKYWSHDLDVCTYRAGVIQACGWWFWHKCWPDKMLGFAIRPPIILAIVMVYVFCMSIMLSVETKSEHLINLAVWIYLQIAILITAWFIEVDQLKSSNPGNWFFQIGLLFVLPMLIPFVTLFVSAGVVASWIEDPVTQWYQQSYLRKILIRLCVWIFLPVERLASYIWNWFWRKKLYKSIRPWMIVALTVYFVVFYLTQWAKIISAGLVLAVLMIIAVLSFKELVEFVVDKTLVPASWSSFTIPTIKKKKPRKTVGIFRLIGMFLTSWYYGICYKLKFVNPDSEQDEVLSTS